MPNLFHNKRAQWFIYALLFIALAIMPLTVNDSFLLNQFAMYGVFGMLAVSISLSWGFGGILNLGQGIAFGLAAYGMAMTMQTPATMWREYRAAAIPASANASANWRGVRKASM